MEVLGISGSLRRASYNSVLLRAAGTQVPAGVEFRIWQGLPTIPAYNDDIDVAPLPVAVFRRALAGADAVLIATPEYNGSVPGALKNALDWASRPFEANALRNKPVAVIGASQGTFGAVWAQAELRKILTTIGACVEPLELAIPRAQDAFDAHGRLLDPDGVASLRAIVTQLTRTGCRRAA